MQRMIRQFAAEYTSKNSSTQDSSRPNSTKNQSLPKSPSGQGSPPPVTTQNPVLSKLLMADQDSPLDLTVKKPPSEEPCEQADGVLDLSTKKSPCSGSPNSSISPSTSNTIGNGTQDTERKAIDPNNSTNLSLEKFMAKLCSHHQKQFFLVLSNLCTEESIMKSRSASISEVENANLEDYDHSSCEKNASLSFVETNKSVSESCLNGHVCITTPAGVHEDSHHREISQCSKVPNSLNFKEDHGFNVAYVTDQTIANNPVDIASTEEKTGAIVAKISEVSQTFSDHCVLSNSNSTLDMSGSELSTNIPKIANKENTQYNNPKQTFLDCSDCKLKQENSVTTVTVKKLGNLCESPFQNLTDRSGSALQKVRLHENKLLKTVKCKNSRVLMTNDCDKQCDVVYISEPITTECHFENHKSGVCARNTARKSTRGYLFSGDCCELSTVRTLVKSSKVEEKGNSALHITEALLIPNGLNETLPTTDDISLLHETRVKMDTYNSLARNDEMKHQIPNIESENCKQILGAAEEPVDQVSDSFIAVFSATQDEHEKSHVPSEHTANDRAVIEHVDEIPKTKQNSSLLNIEADSLPVKNHENIAKLAIYPDFDFSHSIISCNQEDQPGPPSLAMEVIVSLENNHVFSEPTSPKCYLYNTAMEEASATLQNSHANPPTEYSSTHGTAERDLALIDSSTPNDSMVLPEDSSDTDIADPVTPGLPLPIQISSETMLDILPKDISEIPIPISSQVVSSTSRNLTDIIEHSVQNGITENAPLIDVKIENVNCQTLVSNGSIEMETKADVLPESKDALSPTKPFHSSLTICAKMVGNHNVKLESNVSKEALHHCDTVSSSECSNNDTFREALKTKEVIGESNIGAVHLDYIDNSLPRNRSSSKPLTPLKRHKKVPAPTDRCLRSREAHDSVVPKNPSLQVLLSYVKGGNGAQRSVILKTEDAPCSDGNLSPAVKTSDGENYFAVSLNSHCKEGKPLFYERVLKSVGSSHFKISEKLKVYFKPGSDERIVSFAKEKKEEANCKCETTNLKNICQLALHKCNNSQSKKKSSQDQSRAKHIALNSLKDKMKYCKSGKLKNQSSGNKKVGSNKQVNRPKFIDWCSEEENQERISNFNDQYTTVHKNWISLEKETVNVTKSKNKADKLKEIWKTKKRIRKPKSVQDTPKCSPMQMLFMNSVKFPDICKWFMETTETKSLVIVKKLNTRLPEEHQLPMMQSPKYSRQSLYPHILQAQRLKKHLKKFASVFPARNDIKTQNSFIKLISYSDVPLNEDTIDTVTGHNDCKKQEPCVKGKKTAPVHILKKYNRLRGNLKYPSCSVNKNKKICVANNAKSKAGKPGNKKAMSTSDLQKLPNSLNAKSVLVKNTKCKKRTKGDSMTESVAQPSKKRKIESKQGFFKNGPKVNKKAVSTKTKVRKLSKIDSTFNSQAPKKQVGKAGVFKTNVMKAKAKSPMQKQSLKQQLVRKRQTRSAKLKQVPPNSSGSPKITSLSSSHRKKELCKKICTVSGKNKRNVASQVRHRSKRSQLEPSTRKGRSLEFK
ncbi:ligand-dependent corepressor isoform X2 [Dendropsophus ebraccatus]